MTIVKHRRASAARWTANNPVLAAGEIGVEKVTGRMKVGNGLTAWNDLPYSAPSAAEIQNTYATKSQLEAVDAAARDYVDSASNSYAATIGNGSATSITVTHNLSTLDVVVSVYRVSTGSEVDCDVTKTDGNTVRLDFQEAPASNSLRVVVIGTAFGNGSPTPTSSVSITDATATGRAVLTAVDAAAARSVLNPQIIYPIGIAADGTTDVSAALKSLIEGLPANSILQLSAGDYYCPSLRAVQISEKITIKGVPQKTRLTGNGNLATNLYGASAASSDVILQIQPEASLRVEDVEIYEQGILVGIENLIEAEDIKLERCAFNESGGVLLVTNSSASFEAGVAAGRFYTLQNLEITECDITNCELGIVFATRGGWNSARVSRCNFTNVGFVSVWIGVESTKPETFFQYQRASFVHHNVFRTMRASSYAQPTDQQAVNGILVMGESALIHDNHIEDLTNSVKWDDAEGIYVKARYFDIHNNVLLNAGGSEGAIAAKGGQWYAQTTLASSMNGLTLPQSTIEVGSTAGFPDNNDLFPEICSVLVETSNGEQLVSFTGKTATSLTGCTGGTGTLSTGGIVKGDIQIGGYLQHPSNPGRISNNTIIFTRTDVLQRGILVAVPNVVVENNLIEGATRTAIGNIVYGHGSLIARNRIVNHAGSSVFASGARNTVWRENTIINHTGSYVPNDTSLYAFFVANDNNELPNRDQSGVQIVNNYLWNPPELTRRIRFVQGNGSSGGNKTASNLIVSGNTGYNIARGIHITTALTALNMVDVDNYWVNSSNPQPDNIFSPTTTFAAQRPGFAIPVSTIVASTTSPLGVGSLEVGHASDTTLARGAAGMLTVEGVELVRRTIQTITSAVSIPTNAGDRVVIINSGGLPTLGTAVGVTCEIKMRNNTGAGVVVATTSNQTIDGLASFTLPAGHAVTLVPDNGNWSVF